MQIALSTGDKLHAIEVMGFQISMHTGKAAEWGLYDPLRGYLTVGGELIAHGVHGLPEAIEQYAQWVIDTDDGRSLRPAEVLQCLNIRPSVVAALPAVLMEELGDSSLVEFSATDIAGIEFN